MWKTTHNYFGTLHIISIVFALMCLAVGIILGKKYQEEKYDRQKDIALTIIGFIFIALEVFKIVFRIVVKEAVDLTLVSFQICSIPMYLLPCLAFMKDSKLKKSFIGFVSFQSFTAAFFYFVKPAAIVKNTAWICLSMHSMLWHALMVASGVFAMISYRLLCKEGFKTFIYSYILWTLTAFIAMIANFIFGEPLDLFSIAPTTSFSYPLLGLFFKSPKPYALFFISFLIYYGLGGLIVYYLGCFITKLTSKDN